MCDAFRDADLLTNAIHEAFAAGISLDQALRGCEQERDNRSHHIYEWTLRSAQLADPAPLVPFLAAVQDNPRELRRFMSVLTGTVPFWEVLGRDNMRRVLTGQ
jgi:hypothetical protein